MGHNLYVTGDEGVPDGACDSNGHVVLDCCKDCGKVEQQLLDDMVCAYSSGYAPVIQIRDMPVWKPKTNAYTHAGVREMYPK